MKAFEEAARDAGRALGDCGAEEPSALVEEIARALAELGEEAPAKRRGAPRRRRSPLPSREHGGAR